VSAPVGFAPSNPVISSFGGPEKDSKSMGWPRPVTLLVGEASIVALASSGHISDLVGEPPESGAFVLGGGLVALGAVGTMFVPWAMADANSEEDRKGTLALLVGCVAVMAAGGYDLYLHANHDPGGAQIFRDNMIALSAVPLVTWGAGRVLHLTSGTR
jgi:hypothetical protein